MRPAPRRDGRSPTPGQIAGSPPRDCARRAFGWQRRLEALSGRAGRAHARAPRCPSLGAGAGPPGPESPGHAARPAPCCPTSAGCMPGGFGARRSASVQASSARSRRRARPTPRQYGGAGGRPGRAPQPSPRARPEGLAGALRPAARGHFAVGPRAVAPGPRAVAKTPARGAGSGPSVGSHLDFPLSVGRAESSRIRCCQRVRHGDGTGPGRHGSRVARSGTVAGGRAWAAPAGVGRCSRAFGGPGRGLLPAGRGRPASCPWRRARRRSGWAAVTLGADRGGENSCRLA
jgi:hypothetical protein